MDIVAALADRRRYERRIERLHQRHLLTRRLNELRQDDVTLASVVLHRGRVARLLARDVASGRYRLEPGELRTIRARGKLREVYTCRLTDLIVHGVVADVVAEALEPSLSARVFSYRPGLSWWRPVAEFAAWLRATRRGRPLRERGVYVLRGDVESYTDSIPLGPGSPLWPMLTGALGPLPPLVEQVVRTTLRVPGGGVATRALGLPMGQPIAPVIANRYLAELDHALDPAAVPGAFYARYGDDFLFAHADADTARGAAATIDAVLRRLSLTVNARKRSVRYLTPPGRPSADWPAAGGAPAVAFLGTRITAGGTVGLDTPKVAALLRDVDRRTAATAATLGRGDPGRLGPAVCAVVNRTLTPRATLTEQRSASALRDVVTDREQLRQLDHRIAQIAASAISGRRGPRAFRDVPYRRMRRDWGLVSLVATRNARGRG